jgi:pre-mRNA-processing factor 39
LTEFPLLYGYWKQYADFEAGKSGITKAIAVYERAIQAIPTSVDLWVFYCQFYAEKSQKIDKEIEEIRK